MCNDVKFEKSSGNVFKDIGFSDTEAEVLSFRTQLTFEVFTLLKKSRLRRAKAAKLLGVNPVDISKLKNGEDDHFSVACLSNFRDQLKCYMQNQVPLSEKDDKQGTTDALDATR